MVALWCLILITLSKQLSTHVDTVHILVAVGACSVLLVEYAHPPIHPSRATVLQCLSDGNQGARGILHIPVSTVQKKSSETGKVAYEGHRELPADLQRNDALT